MTPKVMNKMRSRSGNGAPELVVSGIASAAASETTPRTPTNARKNSQWVTFDGNHETAPPLPELTAEQTEILITIYADTVAATGEGSDNIAYDSGTANLIAKRFSEAVGKRIPAPHLVAKVTAIRKRGLLPPAAKQTDKPEGAGFDDIDQIGKAE